ncbi:phage tail assembly chaperone [Cupriavidus sp. SIMBA_020]|uniref:phage tail assembly chaperone n=1 Tax=Cupriavidus sp. SIMBA_020 TaxID=3085766 RepID=UPI00397AF792
MGREIQLGGNAYSIGRLTAKQQFHVSRRIAPIIPPLIPVFVKLAKTSGGAAGAMDALTQDLDGFGQVLQPFADALAAMNDADADYVMDNCLTAVQRQQPTGWARVVSPEQKTLMFQDMDMAVILPLVVQVIVANLGPFIQGLLTSQASSPESVAQAG